jgi:hypothetical protein
MARFPTRVEVPKIAFAEAGVIKNDHCFRTLHFQFKLNERIRASLPDGSALRGGRFRFLVGRPVIL